MLWGCAGNLAVVAVIIGIDVAETVAPSIVEEVSLDICAVGS